MLNNDLVISRARELDSVFALAMAHSISMLIAHMWSRLRSKVDTRPRSDRRELREFYLHFKYGIRCLAEQEWTSEQVNTQFAILFGQRRSAPHRAHSEINFTKIGQSLR